MSDGAFLFVTNCQGLKIVSSEPLASAFERSKPQPGKAGGPVFPFLGESIQ